MEERALLALAYGCGLRVGEIERLDGERVRLAERLLVVERGKYDKRRVIPLSAGVRRDLLAYARRSRNPAGEPAFLRHGRGGRLRRHTIQKWLTRLAERAGVSKSVTGPRAAAHYRQPPADGRDGRRGSTDFFGALVAGHDAAVRAGGRTVDRANRGSVKELDHYLQEKYSAASLTGYRHAIGRYLTWMGGEAVARTADYGEVLGYVNELRKGKLRPRTLHNLVFGVKIYYHYLVATGKRNDHPCRRLRLRDAVDRRIRLDELYTAEDLDEVLTRGASKMARLTERNRVITGLLVYQAFNGPRGGGPARGGYRTDGGARPRDGKHQ